LSLQARKTSISLEDVFWNSLKEIAVARGNALRAVGKRHKRVLDAGKASNAIAQFALDFPRQESVCGDHGRRA
jgi:hypothetical protein